MKIALVHDDLMQWGGAEKVLAAISEVFPEAPIFTAAINWDNPLIKENFQNKKIITSFIQKIPGWKGLYKPLLPFYPIAFELFDFSEYDLVISQTTRFAKSIITKPETKHICYCHTPPRFLWNFSGEKTSKLLNPYFSFLRLYDQQTASRVDQFLAGSFNAQKRIQKVYHRDSKVLQPFVDVKEYADIERFEGGYYLIIARLNPYKKVDLAIKACQKLKRPLKVIGVGPEMKKLIQESDKSIEFLGSVTEEHRLRLLAGSKALILCAEEDFGMTPLEAQAAGKPVIAFGKGGALETVVEKETGVLFPEQTVDSLVAAIEKFESKSFKVEDCIENALKFSKEKFQEKLKRYVQ